VKPTSVGEHSAELIQRLCCRETRSRCAPPRTYLSGQHPTCCALYPRTSLERPELCAPLVLMKLRTKPLGLDPTTPCGHVLTFSPQLQAMSASTSLYAYCTRRASRSESYPTARYLHASSIALFARHASCAPLYAKCDYHYLCASPSSGEDQRYAMVNLGQTLGTQ